MGDNTPEYGTKYKDHTKIFEKYLLCFPFVFLY